MNTKLLWILTFAMVPACAHPQTTAKGCPVCQNTSISEEENEQRHLLAADSRNCGDYKELNDIHDRSIAYVERWKTSFLEISTMVVETFSVDSDEEDAAIANGNTNTHIRYKIEFIGGVMHISFSDEQLFSKGESKLTPLGKTIVLKMGEVLESADQRQVTIASRTTVRSEKKNSTKWLTVRGLSYRRSATITNVLEKSGINPRTLAAASLSNYGNEDALERATTTFIIYPSPREAPRYPNSVYLSVFGD